MAKYNKHVRADIILPILHHIASHGGVAGVELRELTGLSKASIARAIGSAREQYGVILSFSRANWEYTVEDWGVFDREKVARFVKYRSESGNG
ncbi:helix-turn-helix domain-containing protein [Methylomonas sp. UP202]|uniref:MarR family transcriptional regulator n=1 Tax=Methylomonas sp. UP202 TaxID=3040943 RepID=UPI0024796FE2|nr:helix-turn-helix domain-containing protein [Methylomonas sp. UP202]WGS88697.1 helix-turn-helix domain-containing protein [Methylomonas sp. UP202]